MLTKPVFIIMISLLTPILSWGQESQEFNLNFDKTSVKKNGLLDNRFNTFFFTDSRGFTWISSLEGLYRFDGYSIKQYNEQLGLSGKNIQSDFFEDEKGNIWFTTWKALNCYNRTLDSILAIPIEDKSGNLLVTGYKAFYVDSHNHRLWLRIGEEIFWINTINPQKYASLPTKTLGVHFSIVSNSRGQLERIVACPWWNGEGIEVFNIKDTVLISYKHYLPEYKNLSKSIHLQDSLWLLISSENLLLFDESTPEKAISLSNTISATFWDAVKTDHHHLFISTDKKGLWYYNWKENRFIKQWKTNKYRPHSLSTNAPRELNLSNNNYLWTSSRNLGVDYTYLYHNTFKNYLEQIKLFNSEIVSIEEDDDQQIWVGTKRHGVKVFSKTGKLISEYNNINNSELWQVSENHEGEIFITTTKYLFHVNQKKNLTQPIPNPDSLTFRFMASIYPERTLISSNRGVKELLKNKKGKYYLAECSEFSMHKEFTFLQFFQTSNRKVYIPHGASDLWIYQATNSGLKSIAKLDCNTEFYGFFESKESKGTIWCGTAKGLAKITQDTIFEFVSTNNKELDSKSIFSIIEDKNGVLWLSSSQGLWQYFPKEKKVFQYESFDGLSSDIFSMYHSGILSKNGEIWLGNIRGLTVFNPENIRAYPILPKIYIRKVTINNNEELKGIDEIKELNLHYSENTLNFEVGTINYYKPEKSRIYFQLAGYQEDWTIIDLGQEIRYTKIPPGNYTLNLKVEDCNGNHGPIYSLPIKLYRPIWKTWWFWFIIASLILIFSIYEFKLQKERKKTQKERKKTAKAEQKLERIELEQKALRAQFKSHFLFNTLNSIEALVINNQIQEASRYYKMLSFLIGNALENSKKNLITLKSELETLKLYIDLELFRFPDKFETTIQVDNKITQDFIMTPPLILQPFVENSIIHAFKFKKRRKGTLNINIFRKGDFIILEIKDNGIGRKQSGKEKPSRGVGLKNTSRRIKLHNLKNNIYIIDLKDSSGNPIGTKVIIELFAPD